MIRQALLFVMLLQFFFPSLCTVPSGSLIEVLFNWARRLAFTSATYSCRRACCSAFSASVRPVVLLFFASSLIR